MKALIVSSELPYPPTSGGAIRTHGIVEGLHQAGHDISLLCYGKSAADHHYHDISHVHIHTVMPPQSRSKFQRIKTLVLSRQPDVAQRLYSSEMEMAFRHILSNETFNLIQFEGIESAWLLPLAKSLQPQAKIAFDTFNAEYALQHSIYQIDRKILKRWPMAAYSWIQSRRIKHYESTLCTLADLVSAVSDEDAKLLRPLRSDGVVYVVNSGIWVDNYSDDKPKDLGSHALVFTGSMDYRPNVDAALWFSNEILPKVRQTIPDAHFYIVGKDPHPTLNPLCQIEGITITGRVDSVLPYLLGATIFVVPLRMGSGTRLKLLEAMAARCAIVATEIAAAGLNEKAKAYMLIANSKQEMADHIISLLNNPKSREELRQKTHDTVRQYYGWPALIPTLLEAYRTVGLDV